MLTLAAHAVIRVAVLSSLTLHTSSLRKRSGRLAKAAQQAKASAVEVGRTQAVPALAVLPPRLPPPLLVEAAQPRDLPLLAVGSAGRAGTAAHATARVPRAAKDHTHEQVDGAAAASASISSSSSSSSWWERGRGLAAGAGTSLEEARKALVARSPDGISSFLVLCCSLIFSMAAIFVLASAVAATLGSAAAEGEAVRQPAAVTPASTGGTTSSTSQTVGLARRGTTWRPDRTIAGDQDDMTTVYSLSVPANYSYPTSASSFLTSQARDSWANTSVATASSPPAAL